MNQTITLGEAILVSVTTVLVWAFIKTILEYVEEDVARRKETLTSKFKTRSFKVYHDDLWNGEDSNDEARRLLEELLGK